MRRLLSKPQLLVDDNEFAEIVSLQEQATASATTSVGNATQSGVRRVRNGGHDAGSDAADFGRWVPAAAVQRGTVEFHG